VAWRNRDVGAPAIVHCIGAAGGAHARAQFDILCGTGVTDARLHAAVANHYTRYNLILIGPYSVGAAWIICSALPYARWRAQSLASGS
jgi:hypothetical protein